MIAKVGSYIEIINPTKEVEKWCHDNLVLDNPEYEKKARLGFWTGNTPRTISLYGDLGDRIDVPFGCLRPLLPLLQSGYIETSFKSPMHAGTFGEVPLYDYQKIAVEKMKEAQYGILQSPAGSGKTQMGIALAGMIGHKTLWLTHTKDLLTQSYERAAQYTDKQWLGKITEGKVEIGTAITFATIQTMCKLDLEQYKDTWDTIIVDECHRVAGTPTAVTMFSKVLNNLRARHKYGLSATVHRADGMIKATFAYLGNVVYTVPDESVKDRVMKVTVIPVTTQICLDYSVLNTDGTINYQKEITFLTESKERNRRILKDLVNNKNHYNLILSERVSHLEELKKLLPQEEQRAAEVITGKMTSRKGKAEREQAIEDIRTGKNHYLFATYQLAKEGLDIPRLDRLYLVTPQKDYAVIVQSVGRVARTFPGKKSPMVYDYIDSGIGLEKSYKRRCTHYRKCGCTIGERR